MRNLRITFSAMESGGWNYLWEQTNAPKDLTLKIEHERAALDNDIHDKLKKEGTDVFIIY